MNKIHKWLIHKLGGVCSTDLAKPTIINIPVDIIPVQAVIRTEKNRDYERYIEYHKEILFRGLVEKLRTSNLVNIKEVDMGDGSVGLMAKVDVVRGEQE